MHKIKILIPVYNDWDSLLILLDKINSEISNLKQDISIIIVNDASNEDKPKMPDGYANIKSLKIINMKINKGHARCNASGLKYIFENEDFDYVIPMDGDGEDRPEEIKNFINHINNNPDTVIVGERVKRSEGFFFKFCYAFHKIVTLIFTGKLIKFGNYTCLPKSIVQKMIKEKSTWSSFSGALTKLTKKRLSIPSIRGSRYHGPSKMNFKNLILHSLSIISVFKMNVLIRSILFLLVYIFLVYQNISIIVLIPVFLVFLLVVLAFLVSKRESLDEINNSLSNISNIDQIK